MLADILGYFTQDPTSIGSLKVDIVKSFEYQFDQDVTGHPVESGFEIHDTIVNKPLQLSMTVGISSHPVTWFYKNGRGKKKFADGLKALEAIRDAKMPVSIVRPEKKYENMVMTSCHVSKPDDSKTIIYADLSFVQITKVTVQTTKIPENIVTASQKENVGETAADGGAASTSDVTGSSDSGTGSSNTSSKSWAVAGVDSIKNGLGLFGG